ncbi:hypothetical protein ILUMI_03576 [Ignelater luminosus]|uniref:F-box domain-containing protein n=1 Tax=Ignelater luminosus TaxID=2038154 RepID=A0A8K0DG24_IGNLU|nr:hypothetical protein ILUMI_03576 [Ignelater luminosus]
MPRDKNSLILQLYVRTPAPCRDYCGLTITKDEMILNIWNITYGPHVYPKRHRCTMEHFEIDKYMQAEILRLFGDHVFKYVSSISKNEKRLENLPSKLFLRILNFMAARDIVNLSQTSKVLFELCNVENVWKMLFRKYLRKRPDKQDLIIGERFGWKQTLKEKIQKKIKESNKIEFLSSKTIISQKESQVNKNCKKITENLKQAKKETKGNTPSDTKVNQMKKIHKIDKLEEELQLKPKVEFTKSFSALNTPATNAKLLNPTKSMANLSNNHYYKNNLVQKPNKNEVKVNNLKTLKNTNIKIEVPKELQTSIDFIKSNASGGKGMLKSLKSKTEIVKKDIPLVRKSSTVFKK